MTEHKMRRSRLPRYEAVEAETLAELAALLNAKMAAGEHWDDIYQPEYVQGRWQVLLRTWVKPGERDE